MSKTIYKKIDFGLQELKNSPGLANAQKLINAIISLLNIKGEEWIPFNDSRRRIFNRASWFHMAQGFKDKRAAYKIAPDNGKNIDLKAFWVKPKRKSILNWVVALTPNYEDEPFNGKFNIGIDFVVPNEADRILVILSKRRILRVLELQGRLAPTQQQILSRWENLNFADKEELHQSLWESFDLSAINKNFYKEISDYFYQLRDFLCENDIFKKERDASVFAIRLIGRAIFCWFLDKKGFIKDSEYYFSLEQNQSDRDYYDQKLKFLFFDLLNTPENKRDKENKYKAPYLNGGLFESRSEEIFDSLRLDFPKGFFRSFFDFLKRYNFTTDESTSSFQQVAIDPEMLGKIFENLLAEQQDETRGQARKSLGAYYTPREIVDYMCKESLRAWLKSKLPPHDGVEECLKKLFDVEWHEFDDQKKNYQRDHIKRYKEEILAALQNIKILDPACGSGAFPMGMLHAILDLHERISTNGIEKKKREVIKNNIYGVDIDPMAIELSKLRIWLSLIIGKNAEKEAPLALPNLDFKFVCADCLIGDLKKQNIPQEMEEARRDYFEASSVAKKKKLKTVFEHHIARVLDSSRHFDPFHSSVSCGFFNPQIMFGVGQGFDIVIGNPPYIQLQKNEGYLGKLYENAGFQTFVRTGDIYQLFYEKGQQLLEKNHALLAYITSNSWLKAKYGKSTRNYFAKKCPPLQLIELGKNAFENAIVDANILIASHGQNKGVPKAVDMDSLPGGEKFPPDKKFWASLRIQGDGPWMILSLIEQAIMDKMENIGTPLKEWDIKINRGIITGYNKAFIIDDKTKEALISEDPKSAEIIKPILRGRDIEKYKAKWAKKWLIGMFPSLQLNVENYPAIKNYLLSFGKERLEQSGKVLSNGKKARKKTNNKWFETQDQIGYYKEFSKEKLLWIELTEEGRFAYDDSGVYGEATTFMMIGENVKYLCSILNSKLISWLLRNMSPTSGMGTLRWKKVYVETIPIPKISLKEQSPFINLLDEILKLKNHNIDANIEKQEREINRLVYQLYDLTSEEVAVIERSG